MPAPQNVQWFDGQPYIVSPQTTIRSTVANAWGGIPDPISNKMFDNTVQSGGLTLIPGYGQQPQAANTPPVMNQNVKQQMGRLTGQASDALYGGILGYQPKPMTAMGGQQFAPPQGNLVDPFLNMQGILGRSQFQTPRMY
jgi:hypothetical protein